VKFDHERFGSDVVDMMRGKLARAKVCVAVAALVGGGVVLVAPSVAGAKSATNTFTFKGTYSGTLKLSPSSLNCSFGKTLNGKSYMVNLSHLKGKISGAGSGPWGLTAFAPKQGTTHVAQANVHADNDTTFQSNGATITAFDETSGTVTIKGKTGSVNLKVEFHTLAGNTYSGSDTVTGSWNCPQGLSLG
jgi:hypothetical protein